MSRLFCAATSLALVFGNITPAADVPVRQVRTQRVGDELFFQVTFSLPADFIWATRYAVAVMPRLVPQDENTRDVYRADTIDAGPTFIGRVQEMKPAKFVLFYPTAPDRSKPAPFGVESARPAGSRDVAVEIDLGRAEQITTRDLPQLPREWAQARVRRLAELEKLSPEAGFFRFAREVTERKYGVSTGLEKGSGFQRVNNPHARMYEMTTGAAALSESLATERVLGRWAADFGERTVDVNSIRGIDIAEHPWKDMMAGKTPVIEPQTELVPFDNYYVTFRSLPALVEFADLVDQWGGDLLRAYEWTSRDEEVRARYEKQLCLPGKELVKAIGPALVRSVTITGSDPYFRTGADVTVIMHTPQPALVVKLLDPFVKAAKPENESPLKSEKWDRNGVPVECFRTHYREICLHRAVVGEFVICSNSRPAMERILDTKSGRRRALADSLDFRYMRTVFRSDDTTEDGYAFLPDAFIRQLVGPASKIKEKRRTEALASLTLAQQAALYHVWETGRLPKDRQEAEGACGLKEDDFATFDGRGKRWVYWDNTHRLAYSEVFGTRRFLTPLLELSIDRVTDREEREYTAFRTEYTRLWRQFFDPVGIRFARDDKQLKLEAYILPLIQSSNYNALRWLTEGKTTKHDPSQIPAETAFRLMFRIPVPDSEESVGDWLSISLDDSPLVAELLRLAVAYQTGPSGQVRLDAEKLVARLPLTLSLGLKDPDKFAGHRRELRRLWETQGLKGGDYTVITYKEVEITKAPVDQPKMRELLTLVHQFLPAFEAQGGQMLRTLVTMLPKEPPEAVYAAVVGKAFHVSLSEEAIKRRIDVWKAAKTGEPTEAAATVTLNPSPASVNEALRGYLAWHSHRYAIGNAPAWEPLYKTNLIPSNASESTKRSAALRYLGFIPVSPDGTKYRYDRRADEVVNDRHGSPRRPTPRTDLDPQSPPALLLNQFRSIRADLRFREDGIHTVLTVERR